MIETLTERHLLPVMTPATILRCVGGIDSNVQPPSFFRFGVHLTEECRPRGICNAFGKTMVMGHPVHLHVFDADDPEPINNLTALLMGEIVTSERYPLVDSCNYLAVFTPLRSAFRKFGVLALDFCQGLFFLAEKARVGYLFLSGECSKRFESHIDAHLGRHIGQAFGFAFYREGDVPLASGGTLNSTGLDLSFDRAVIDYPDAANLGEGNAALMRETETRLGKGERVISSVALEAWQAWFLGMLFAASEKGFHRQVNPHRHILQDLGMDRIKRSTFQLQYRKGGLLLVECQTLASLLIGLLTLFQQVVIEPTALFKSFVELRFLFLGWV